MFIVYELLRHGICLFVMYEEGPQAVPVITIIIQVLHARSQTGLQGVCMISKEIHYEGPHEGGLHLEGFRVFSKPFGWQKGCCSPLTNYVLIV